MKEITLTTYLECFHKTLPPSGIVHIGAGGGVGISHHWRSWDIPCVVLIDAETSRYDWLKITEDKSLSYVFSETVSDHEAENTLYVATNPAETGLIPAEKLNRIWPNLETIETRDIKTTCLFTILDQLPQEFTKQINWLVIDCFPALAILKGATDKYLDQASILLLRVILDDNKVDDDLSEARLSVITPFLSQKAYRLIVVEESNHPAVGLALFSKDWRVLLENVNDRYIDLSQVNADLEKLVAILNSEREHALQTQQQLQQQLVEAQVQNQANEQACLALQTRLDQLDEQNNLLSAAKVVLENQITVLNCEHEHTLQTEQQLQQQLVDAQALNQANEQACLALQAQLDQLSEHNNQLDTTKTDLENQVAVLNGEREQLRQANHLLLQQLREVSAQHQHQEINLIDLGNKLSDAEKLAQERLQHIHDTEQALIDKNHRIAQLEAEIKETVTRQQMLNEEMLKAEAQLELMKDVLLRDPGL
ncbi:MAG: hypothetical protein Q7U57_09975 [Methylovulum sp.]|nr:hypothetical protein [Methylovulum sp.]